MCPMPASCELCTAARVTPWYYEDDICWIAECEICEGPMVVWRSHGVAPPGGDLAPMHAHLREVAGPHFGQIFIAGIMSSRPNHHHAPGRTAGGFFGRNFPARRAADP